MLSISLRKVAYMIARREGLETVKIGSRTMVTLESVERVARNGGRSHGGSDAA